MGGSGLVDHPLPTQKGHIASSLIARQPLAVPRAQSGQASQFAAAVSAGSANSGDAGDALFSDTSSSPIAIVTRLTTLPSSTDATPSQTLAPVSPVTTTKNVVEVVESHKAPGLSTLVIVIISACGGLAIFLIMIGCLIARRRRSKKNDWLTALLASEADAESPPSSRGEATVTREKSGSESAPIPPTTASTPMQGAAPPQMVPQQMPWTVPQILPFMSLPFMQQPQPQPQPAVSMLPMTQASLESRSQHSIVQRKPSIVTTSRTQSLRTREYSVKAPHFPGQPSVEPRLYDDGAPTKVDPSHKRLWLKRSRRGVKAEDVLAAPPGHSRLLPADEPPSPDHSVWDGGSTKESDILTSVSRRGQPKVRPGKKEVFGAPVSSVSTNARKFDAPVSLSNSDLQSRNASTRQSPSRNADGSRVQGAFSLSPSDLNPLSSFRGISEDGGKPQSSLAPTTALTGNARLRHPRIHSLIRSDHQRPRF